MAIALAVSGIAFAAFCVWLTVRIVNRRERWAKWMAAGVVVLGYPLSFGPVAWLLANAIPPASVGLVLLFYMPLMLVAEMTVPTHDLLQWYVNLWADNVSIGPSDFRANLTYVATPDIPPRSKSSPSHPHATEGRCHPKPAGNLGKLDDSALIAPSIA